MRACIGKGKPEYAVCEVRGRGSHCGGPSTTGNILTERGESRYFPRTEYLEPEEIGGNELSKPKVGPGLLR